MPEPCNKVLCPIEFDAGRNEAIAIAKSLIRKDGGTVYLMHVVAPSDDPLAIGVAPRPTHSMEQVSAAMERIAREQLADVHYELVIAVGEPADEVLRVERELQIDRVVMPTHRHHEFLRLLSDGVSHKVIDESLCPVITVPERVWAKGER